MNTIVLDNGTYNDISWYAKLNNISIADALKAGVNILLENFKTKRESATEAPYYISPKVKALETGFRCPESVSTDYKEEMSAAFAEKYL